MAHYFSDEIYTGEEKLVISFDIGTTNTAVSYAHLYPGVRTEVKLVNKWPGQPIASGNCKIPSIIAYQNGKPVAFGAEAEEYLDDSDYNIALWFKLHLHPDWMTAPEVLGKKNETIPMEIPPLPPSTTLLTVYVDFMKYLYRQTRLFINNNTFSDQAISDRFQDNIDIVLATPNGWDTTQHMFLRKAAIMSGMVEEHNADIQLTFVTEGEASVHYALAHNRSGWLKDGTKFVVTDAGGSTVDSTLYECKATEPSIALKEVCASECVQAGGVMVDRNAGVVLKAKLELSRFNDDESITRMIQDFEAKTKRLFDGSQKTGYIRFGRSNDNDRPYGILKGRLALTSLELWGIFDGCVRRIVNSVSKLANGRKVEYIVLTGGFGESPYLRVRLEEAFGQRGMRVITVDEPSKKAAAEGATIWFIKKSVVARAMRFTLGTSINVPYKKNIDEHLERKRRVIIEPDGTVGVPGGFGCILKKDTVIQEDFMESHEFAIFYEELPEELETFEFDIFVWRGEGCPKWIEDKDGKMVDQMEKLCVLKADLSHLSSSLRVEEGIGGRKYWEAQFSVVIQFWGTAIKAALRWSEEGEAREGPVTILPNSTSEFAS